MYQERSAGRPDPNVPLASCQLRYLGRAAPANVANPLEAIQKPLLELQPVSTTAGAFDTVLTVYPSQVIAQSPFLAPGDKRWPIQNLQECGAFKEVDGYAVFLPLVSVEAQEYPLTGPPFFAMSFQRCDIDVIDSWVFVTQSDEEALELLYALKAAFCNREGWLPLPVECRSSVNCIKTASGHNTQLQGESSSSTAVAHVDFGSNSHGWNSVNGNGAVISSSQSWNADNGETSTSFQSWNSGNGSSVKTNFQNWNSSNGCAANGIQSWNNSKGRELLKDFCEKPSLQGYFYTPSSSLVKKYSVSGAQTAAPAPAPTPAPAPAPTSAPAPALVQLTQPVVSPFSQFYSANVSQMSAPSTCNQGYPQPQVGFLPTPYGIMPEEETKKKKKKKGKKKNKKDKKKKGKKKGVSDDSSSNSSSSSDEEEVLMYVKRNGRQEIVLPEGMEIVEPSSKSRTSGKHQDYRDYIPAGQQEFKDYIPAKQQDYGPGMWQTRSAGHTDRTDQAAGHYESRIFQSSGAINEYPQMRPGPDPFVDEGPYERRLPGGGYFNGGAGAVMMAEASGPPGGRMLEDASAVYGSNFILKHQQRS